jgi:hypothetical protein
MAEEHEKRSNDPRAYELEVTLHEDDDLIYAAEYAPPAGFAVPADRMAAPRAVELQGKILQTRFSRELPLRAAAGGAETAIKAITLAWDFIKDGRPTSAAQGASTAVLASTDMAWEHYAAAQKFTSKKYTYRVKNKLGFQTILVQYVARGSYQAQYAGKVEGVPPGDYMPSVEIYCSKIDVGWGWNVNAKATLSQLTNVGPVGGRLIPDFYTTLHFNCWTWICNFTDTYPYSLRGDRGFVGPA